MSPNKPKRPSARPSASRSSAPPPGPPPEVKVEIPRAAAVPEVSPARLEKKKLRVSARRGPATERMQAALPESPRLKARDAGTLPVPRRARPVKAAAPKPPENVPEPPAETPASEAATNGASKHVAVQSPLFDAPSDEPVEEPTEDNDEDIWNEADTGLPAVHLLADSRADSPERPAADDSEPPAVSRLARSRRDGARDEAVRLGSAQTLVSTDYYFRQYGAHGMRSLSAEVDEFGLDPHVEERARPWLEGLCKRYFRVDVDGVHNLPADGRVLMVCNRAGALPWDGLVLRTAVRMERPELQPVRWLAEDSVFHYPFLGVFMNRLGAVRACPENAERLLKQDRLVAVFPEGAQGSTKLFKDRYRLQRFGRGGYVKLALKLGAPIVPTAIIGSEETNPVLARSRWLGRVLGSESLPITPTFPWLGAAGLLPAPVKWRIVVGEPIDLSSYGPKSADEALLVHRLNEQIRGILQQLVESAVGARRSVLFG